MRIRIDTKERLGKYEDPTVWQNSTLRYSPPEDFPPYLAKEIGRAKIMRVWITLDEYWDHRTGAFYPDYDIGVARYDVSELHYPYDWKNIVPAPSGTRFKGYLTSHAENADELLLNVRRYEREVSDGVITYDQYEEIFEKAVEYCKELAPNIRYIECCNEIDIKSFGLLSAEEYVRIYHCAYRAVRRLNQKHCYSLPLEIGGYAAAHPLIDFERVTDIMRLLSESDIGTCPMDFYSYHHYDTSMTAALITRKEFDLAELGGVGKLRKLMQMHNEMLEKFSLPKKPVFLNELGKARTTGVDGDSLFNAAGLITYLIAYGSEGLENMYPFPWCTFHNPELQISYTQFLLNEDGSYSATPNGMAIKMLHSLKGDKLKCTVSDSIGRDPEFQAVATENDGIISVVCTNPSGETVPGFIEIYGLSDGVYKITGHACTSVLNNCVTGKKHDGKRLEVTGEAERTSSAGVLRHMCVLEANGFALYRIEKI
ncbi:MAG: hypothetical protein IIX97_07150 [Clostridia bacterium]|nr:hypothetical protein [Clostridia bacterium]